MEQDYKAKLRAFCEGLECRNIDELLENSPESFKKFGEVMAKTMKLAASSLDQIDTMSRFADILSGGLNKSNETGTI